MSGPMRYFAVTNLERHQHYKDRRPPWIKLHVAILDDYDFARLHDASKAHAMLIWALASQRDNRLPMDPAWIGQKISATGPVDLDGLVSAGFLTLYDTASDVLALRKQSALVETETEAEAQLQENSQSSARVADAVVPGEAELAALLTTNADRVALTAVCAVVPRVSSWLAEMRAALDGMHGTTVTPAQLGEALRDYVANGALDATASLKHFRAYLHRAARAAPKDTGPPAHRPMRPVTPPPSAYTSAITSSALDDA